MPCKLTFIVFYSCWGPFFLLTFHHQFVLLHRFSNRPKRALTSRFLISLLIYRRVPEEYFLELLRKALEDVNKARHKPRDSLEGRFITVGRSIIVVFLQTLDGWVYIDLYMGLLMGLYTWAQYTPTITTCLYYKDRSYTV